MATRPARKREQLHIGGVWRTPDEYIEVTDLAEGGQFARVAAAAPADADDAIGAAKRAEPELRETTVVRRPPVPGDVQLLALLCGSCGHTLRLFRQR